MSIPMVTLEGGCQVPRDRECEVCDKIYDIRELKWYRVHNHPSFIACPACRKKMDTWEPLPEATEEDNPDNIKVKIGKPKRKSQPSLMEMHRARVPKPEPEPEPAEEIPQMEIGLDALDDLEGFE